MQIYLQICKKKRTFVPEMAKSSSIIVPNGCSEVLLHACCAPCSSAIVEWLLAHEIKPVIYYFNPNIYPFEEYEKRKNESKRHAASLGIEWIEEDYSHQSWWHSICGLENEPERGKRCAECFYHRLFATARMAQEMDIRFFATTLASSRWKDLEQINAAGKKAEEMVNKYPKDSVVHEPVTFWAQNWRKDGLQERRNELIKEYEFYNQTYCGCEYSMRSEHGSMHREEHAG